MDDESNEIGDDLIENHSPDNRSNVVNRIVSSNRIDRISNEFILDTFQNLMRDCKSLSNTSSNKYLVTFYNQYENVYDKLTNTRMKYSDFNILKTIGQGAFGQVQLVRHKPTGELFALKILNKAQVVTCEGTIFWREERDIMVEIDSRWIVKMHYSFQDSKRLYMVMDYLPGGNLVNWMSKLDVLSEKDVCFYAAEIVLAIHDLHKYGFVHRDIKPDNILFTERGHIKLADFGSCVKLDPKTKYVNCNRAIGTPDYISPEVLLSQSNNTKYGKEVDWWALGVMLYEIFYGEPPFYSDNLVNTYSKIMTHEQSLSFPPDEEVSEMAVDFMKNLICDRSIRLGQTDDLSDIKSHRFFSSANTKWKWDNIQDFTPPFIPELENDLDTTYFDFEDEDVDKNFLTINSQELKPTIFNGENLQFSGFSYTKYENTVSNCQKENNKSDIHLEGKDRAESKINNQIETNKDALDKLLIEKKDLENQLHTANSNLKSEALISKKLQIDYSELLKNHANCEKKIENLEETTHKLSAELIKHQNSSVQEKENLLSEMKKMETYSKSSSLKLMEMQAEYHQSKLRCIKLENDLSRLKNDGSLQEKVTNINDSDQLRSDLEKALTENNSLSKSFENLQNDKEKLKSSVSDLESAILIQTKNNEEKDKIIKDLKIEIEKYKMSLEDREKKEQATNYKMSLIVKSRNADRNKYDQELEDQRNKLSKIIQTKTYEIQQMKANIDTLTESNMKLSELVELDKVKQNSLIEKINEIILGQSSTAKEMMIAEDLKSGILKKRAGRHYIQLSKEGKKKEYMYGELQKQFNNKSAELMKQIDMLNKEKEQLDHENSTLKEQVNGLMTDQMNLSDSVNRGSVSTIASSHSSFDSGFLLDSSHVSSTPCRRSIKQFGKPPLNHLHSLKTLSHNSKHDLSDVFQDAGDEFSDLKIRSKKPTVTDYRHSKSASATLERPRIDQQLEVNVKLKGKKMTWEKRFVQCDDLYIYFYGQDMNKCHLKILISSLDFVRSVTPADVIHAKKTEIPRIFQICYDKNAIYYMKTLLTKSMSRSSNSLNSGDSGKSANSVDEHDSTIQQDIVEKKESRKSSLSRFITIIGTRNRKPFKDSLETIMDSLDSPICLRGHLFQMVNIDKISTCHICNQPFDSSSVSNETKTLANSDSKIVSSESSGPLLSLVYLHKVYQCYHCSIKVHGNDLHSKIFFCKESSTIQLCRASSEVEQANWIKYLNQFVKSQANTSVNSGAATPVMKNHPLVN